MLERKSLEGDKINTSMLIANFAMIMLMFVHIPVNYVPARNMIILMLYKKENFTFR